jgi:SAM-dependent methyltransferase
LSDAPADVGDDRRVDAGGGGTSWSDIAGWYDELVEAGSGPHETAVGCLLGLLPDLGGAMVLDLACGQGLATRAVAEAGAAHVVGVDLSAAMVERARAHGTSRDLVYEVGDAQRLDGFADASFDGVTCQLGLMDIPDLDATLASVHRVLVADGWFAFVIGHPCSLTPGAGVTTGADGRPAAVVNGYFHERFWRSPNAHGVRRAGNHHRTLGTYLNALLRTGFVLEAVAEPTPTDRLAAQQPVYAEVPIFFAVRARRAG